MRSSQRGKLLRLSAADPLTTIANRRAFDEALETEWRQALTDRTTLALLLIDVDCFKPFNDNYGHVVGDQCLRRVAEVLARGARRAGETIARYGGDEFAILLPRTDPERASALARHLCKKPRAESSSACGLHRSFTASKSTTRSAQDDEIYK